MAMKGQQQQGTFLSWYICDKTNKQFNKSLRKDNIELRDLLPRGKDKCLLSGTVRIYIETNWIYASSKIRTDNSRGMRKLEFREIDSCELLDFPLHSVH